VSSRASASRASRMSVNMAGPLRRGPAGACAGRRPAARGCASAGHRSAAGPARRGGARAGRPAARGRRGRGRRRGRCCS
jgi:hypothetical protein